MKKFKEMFLVGNKAFRKYKSIYLLIPVIYFALLMVLKVAKHRQYEDPYRLKAGHHGLFAMVMFYIFYECFTFVIVKYYSNRYHKRKVDFLTTVISGFYLSIKYTLILGMEFITGTPQDVFRYSLFKKICFLENNYNVNLSTKESEILFKRFYKQTYVFGRLNIYQSILIIPFFFMYKWVDSNNISFLIISYFILLLFVIYFFLRFYLVVYQYHLVIWNRMWEKTYSDLLKRNQAAPNINTIPFPEL